MNTAMSVYTIGHSDRSIEDFLSLLKTNDIQVLVDIRAYPHSSRFPHFSENYLREVMKENHIDYHWAGRQLGGMRKPVRATSHPALDRDSFRGFAEYMETGKFENAIEQLLSLASASPTAIMCAEKDAFSCHRSLISDYLSVNKINVKHIIDNANVLVHKTTDSVRVEPTGLVYDRNTSGSFNFD